MSFEAEIPQDQFDESWLSDLYKEVYGFRPRGLFWEVWEKASVEDKRKIQDGLLEANERQMEEERIREDDMVADFEVTIMEIRSILNCNEEKAIEVYLESLGLKSYEYGDPGYVLWSAHLPYSLEKRIANACLRIYSTRIDEE